MSSLISIYHQGALYVGGYVKHDLGLVSVWFGDMGPLTTDVGYGDCPKEVAQDLLSEMVRNHLKPNVGNGRLAKLGRCSDTPKELRYRTRQGPYGLAVAPHSPEPQ